MNSVKPENYPFVPPAIALLAKNNGFDEECDKIYVLRKNQNKYILTKSDNCETNSLCVGWDIDRFTAPRYEQLMDWLREEKKIFISIEKRYDSDSFLFKITPPFKRELEDHSYTSRYYENYYEAKKDALTKVFELKLIAKLK